jgi:hypothetical protein
MAAYLVLMQQVHDVSRYDSAYLPGLMPFSAKAWCRGVGGSARNQILATGRSLRFADMAAAWGLLAGPDYQSAKRFVSRSPRGGQPVIASAFAATESWLPPGLTRATDRIPTRGCCRPGLSR